MMTPQKQSQDKANKIIAYTSDAALKAMCPGDKTIEIKGFISEIKPVKNLPSGSRLLKFVLSNGNKKLYVLVWNDLIHKYESQLQINRILHIEAGQCCKSKIIEEDTKLLLKEIIIQSWTSVQYLGFHRDVTQKSVCDVDFNDIASSKGLIRIKGYIRTCFTLVPLRSGQLCAFGAVTNGERRIPVEIQNCTQTSLEKGIEKGTCVSVTGVLKDSDGPLKISCSDMSAIVVIKEVPKLDEETLEGAFKLIKRPHPESDSDE